MQEKLENEGFIQGHESIDDMLFSFFPKRLNPLFKKRKKTTHLRYKLGNTLCILEHMYP